MHNVYSIEVVARQEHAERLQAAQQRRMVRQAIDTERESRVPTARGQRRLALRQAARAWLRFARPGSSHATR
jgi:hypothetical protein